MVQMEGSERTRIQPDPLRMNRFCCLANCTNFGEYPLSKIQGVVQIKKEFINTLPRDWKLCPQDFERILRTMDCCVDGCPERASYAELPADMVNVRIKPDCSHHQLCVRHASLIAPPPYGPPPLGFRLPFTHLPQEQALKRRPEIREDAAPPMKREVDDDTITEEQHDDDDTSTQTEPQETELCPTSVILNTAPQSHSQEQQPEPPLEQPPTTSSSSQRHQHHHLQDAPFQPHVGKPMEVIPKQTAPKHEETVVVKLEEEAPPRMEMEQPTTTPAAHPPEAHTCCIANCSLPPTNEIEILQPMHVFVCAQHLQEITQRWKVSLLKHEVVLNDECFRLVQQVRDPKNPLFGYANDKKTDTRCALCCGLFASQTTYTCSFCHFTFCLECYKQLCLTLGTPQQFISNKANWKCFVCANSDPATFRRNGFIKSQLEGLIAVIDARLKDGCVLGSSFDELIEFIKSVNPPA